ncbi:MAG: sigma-70 family RNA polymerase sigma factor [Solirubrobacterales bacterium]
MEASTLSHAARRGLLTRKSPLLKLKGDEQLIAMVRSGNSGAFDIIVDRYQARLLGFCRQMIGSTEDAEDVLQEVFVNAYKAMLADNREINLRPWLYRIARNRSLNHLRKPKADAQESMDMVPMVDAGSTAEKVHNREEFRQLLNDVTKLPETQRAALLLREIDALSYEEIAEAMDTTVPSVKSLLVRARISLAEASQSRMLTCGEVRVELAEAAEGLNKVSGPVRRHVRDCDQCEAFRKQLRSDSKVLAMIMPIGPLLALKAAIAAKVGFGGATAGSGAAGAGAGAGAATVSGAAGAAAGGAGAAAASGIGAVTSAVGIKALAGVVTAAVITVGAVEVSGRVSTVASNQGVEAPSRVVAVSPDAASDGPIDVAMIIKASAEPPVVDPIAPATTEGDATEAPGENSVPPTEVAPSDGLDGEVVNVPISLPPEPSGPEVPVEVEPGTVGQVIAQPTSPVAQPDTPLPSAPTPAPPVETAPQDSGQ